MGLNASGNTNFPLAFRESLKLLRESRAHRRLLILLTDGDLTGRISLEELLLQGEQMGVDTTCIGVEGCEVGKLKLLFGEQNGIYVPRIEELAEKLGQLVVARV